MIISAHRLSSLITADIAQATTPQKRKLSTPILNTILLRLKDILGHSMQISLISTNLVVNLSVPVLARFKPSPIRVPFPLFLVP